MPSKKITAMPDLAGGQVPTDLLTAVDLSQVVALQNVKSTLHDVFSIITKNITDKTVRYQDSVAAAPAVSAANTGAMNYNATRQTFQGSRNGSAYADLLFGTGSVTQIAYWTSLIDQLEGSASWTFNNTTKTVTLSHTNNTPNFIIQNTTAATPNEIRGFLSAPTWQVIGFDATGNGGILRLFGGRTGPLFPLQTAELGVLRFAGVNGAGTSPTTRGGGSIKYIATANLGLAEGGSGMTISCTPNGSTTDTVRFTITGSGACILGANGTGPTATLGGTATKVSIGNLTTYNANAAIQCGNPALGDDNITFLVQGNPGQTQGVFRCEQSTGQTLYLIGIAGSHTYASTAIPAVSPANQGRIYYDVATQHLMLSNNGGAYAAILTGTGSGMAIGNTITSATAGSVLFAGAAGVLAQDNANFFFDNGNDFLGVRTNTPAATIHVKCKAATNEGMRVDSNSGAVQSQWFSDGTSAFIGTTSGHLLEIQSNGTTLIALGAGGITLGFFGVSPVVRQTMGAATAGGVYTAAEQAMLQAVYDAVRNIGIGT